MFLSDLWPHSGCPGSLQHPLPTQWFSSFPGWLSFRAQQWELLMFRHVPWTKVLKPIRKRWRILQTRRIGTTGRTRSNWKVWLLMITCDYSWLDSIIFFDGASYGLRTGSSILYLLLPCFIENASALQSLLVCICLLNASGLHLQGWDHQSAIHKVGNSKCQTALTCWSWAGPAQPTPMGEETHTTAIGGYSSITRAARGMMLDWIIWLSTPLSSSCSKTMITMTSRHKISNPNCGGRWLTCPWLKHRAKA